MEAFGVFFMDIDRGRQSYGTNLAFIGLHCVLVKCLAVSWQICKGPGGTVLSGGRVCQNVTTSD